MVGITVLAYHRFGATTPISVDLPVALVAEQLDALQAHSCVVSLDDAVETLAGTAAAPSTSPQAAPPVVLTADDGTADWVEVLLPLLVTRRLPMTWYVATRFVDEQVPFPHGGRPISWSALREAVSTGLITIGSHTHSHAVMSRLDHDTAAAELDRSRDRIESEIGAACRHLAYPKAMAPSHDAERAVRERFVSAALAGNRPNRPGRTDLARLGRTPIKRTDQGKRFDIKIRGGARLEGFLRERYDRLRYQHDVT